MDVMALSPTKLRNARESVGLSQVEAAESAGVSRATLQNAEAGRWSPRADTLARLAALYRVRIDDLFVHDVDADTADGGSVLPGPNDTSPTPTASRR